MARGRKAHSDQVKALKGSSAARRRIAIAGKKSDPAPEEKQAVAPDAAPHEFLTTARQQKIYKAVVDDFVARRIARKSDLAAYARWAYYVDQWLKLKKSVGRGPLVYTTKSKHGTMVREQPDFKIMLRLESAISSLEDRIGLNPQAREAVIRGLSTRPPAWRDDQPAQNSPEGKSVSADAATAPEPEAEILPLGPAGFLMGSKAIN